MTDDAPSKHALAFIFIAMLIDTIGLGIIIPVTPKLIAQLTHQGMGAAAVWGGWLSMVYALMQFLCAPIIGNLSDRFGRRPVLILSIAMLGIDYAITGLAPTIAWLFIGRFLSGAAGASYSTANAYIADVSPPEKRAANFGLTGAAFGIGFVLGPVIGGIIGDYFGPRTPFFVSAVFALCNAIYGLVVLKESLPPSRRRAFELWRANPLGALKSMQRFPMFAGMIGVVALMRLAHDANPSIWSYYTILKFHWTPAQVGYSLMAVGISISLVFGFLTRIIIPRIGEMTSVIVGLACAAVGFFGYAYATQGWMLFVWLPIWSLSGLATPSINAILSKQVGPHEQGELQGALASIGGLTSIVAPALMTNLFGYFTSGRAPIYFPGASFFTAALCELGAMAIFFAMLQRAAPQPAE